MGRRRSYSSEAERLSLVTSTRWTRAAVPSCRVGNPRRGAPRRGGRRRPTRPTGQGGATPAWGIALTFVAVAALAAGTTSGWWPGQEAPSSAVEVTTRAGVVCGDLVEASPGSVGVVLSRGMIPVGARAGVPVMGAPPWRLLSFEIAMTVGTAEVRHNICAGSDIPAAATFSSRCCSERVPGIGSITRERESSQARATCAGVAPSCSAACRSAL